MESIGCISEGIKAMKWSPDGEILVIFSCDDNCSVSTVYLLVCHGNELDFLTEFPFSTTEFGEGTSTVN